MTFLQITWQVNDRAGLNLPFLLCHSGLNRHIEHRTGVPLSTANVFVLCLQLKDITKMTTMLENKT